MDQKIQSYPNIDRDREFDEIIDDISQAYARYPSVRAVYSDFSMIFHRILQTNTSIGPVTFYGPYAATDHLLHECQASPEMIRDVNDMRVRLRNINSKISDSSLATNCRYDYETLCRFAALVYKKNVPARVSSNFGPPRVAVNKPLQGIVDSIRCIVTDWDKKYIYVNADGFDDTMRVKHTTKFRGADDCTWSYICDMLSAGDQLSLVRCRVKDDTISADLIIYQPDYLVNISEIASCFSAYGDDPLNHLIKRLQPEVKTEAILLGNVVGHFLDEQINNSDNPPTFVESMTNYFRYNAVGMLGVTRGPDFPNKAKAQRYNIQNAIKALGDTHRNFNRERVVLEPSFISPMLGLQGRMDLLQLDHDFLVEQKSGKSAFPEPYSDEMAPKPQEPHYVQLLLYRALLQYNYPKQWSHNNGVSSYLMYSKYAKSMVGLGTAPDLLYRAIKVRNCIAHQWIEFAKDGFGILRTLTPERLRTGKVSDSFWDKYCKPQIADVLDTIHNAPDIEQKYFYTMLRFIANEHLLAKLGSSVSGRHGMASIWLDPTEIKAQSGDIYTGLTITSPRPDHNGDVSEIVVSYADDDDSMSNFRKGDIVILYPYDENGPAASETMIQRCTIKDLKPGEITLRLRAKQSSAKFLYGSDRLNWAVEHDFMESSFNSLYRGTLAFLQADPDRRHLLLGLRRPRVDRSITLNGDYGQFNELCLRVKRAQDLFLIIGPPGTGKTSFGMLNTLLEELTESSGTVLAMAYTNRAVDEICGKLTEAGVDFLRVGSAVTANHQYLPYFLETKAETCKNINELRDIVIKARVIVGTTTAICGNQSIFMLKKFSLAIIDEASQILEPHLLPIMSAKHNGQPAISKFVMIGDHKQLPAVVQQSSDVSRVDDAALNAIGLTDCRLSMFERFLKLYANNPDITYMLTRQGRMHREIAEFPSNAFYDGRLQPVPLEHQCRDLPVPMSHDGALHRLIQAHRLSFIAVRKGDSLKTSDKVNLQQARMIAALVVEIYWAEADRFSVDETVGVIVPYRNQIASIRSFVKSYNIPQLLDISIDTVERYQGSQRKYIIYGTTISKYYQLQFLCSNTFVDNGNTIDRKLNVALTRAKEYMMVVGDPGLLRSNPLYARLIDYTMDRGTYYDVPLPDLMSGSFEIKV